jgi:hypothetical protein
MHKMADGYLRKKMLLGAVLLELRTAESSSDALSTMRNCSALNGWPSRNAAMTFAIKLNSIVVESLALLQRDGNAVHAVGVAGEQFAT